MPERADVYVKNTLKKGDLKVGLKYLNDEPGSDTSISKGNRERVYLGDTEVLMVIDVPGRTETKSCFFKASSDVDFTMSFSRTKSKWTIKIDHNKLPHEAPTSVNVEVGEDEPEYPETG